MDRGDGGSAADRLIGLVLESGTEFSHDPNQTSTAGLAFVSMAIGRITRSAPGRASSFCSGAITGRPAGAPARKQSAPYWNCSRRKPCLTVRHQFAGRKSPRETLSRPVRPRLAGSRDRRRRLAHSKSTAAEISSHTRLPAAAPTRARRRSRRITPLPERRPSRLDSNQGVSGRGAASRRALPHPGRQR